MPLDTLGRSFQFRPGRGKNSTLASKPALTGGPVGGGDGVDEAGGTARERERAGG
jgi:hypothetical protein